MRMIRRFFYVTCVLFRTNMLKTLWFNFNFLPLYQAIKLPILLYGRVYLKDCNKNGKINFLEPFHFGSWEIGRCSCFGENSSIDCTYIAMRGTLRLGERGIIRNGVHLVVNDDAILTIHNQVEIGPRSKIYCSKSIEIGCVTHLSWECQVFDTDFHYMYDENGVVKRMNRAIKIGNQCWIGNRVTITKGSILNDYSIIAQCSLVNKDFSSERFWLIGGVPAKTLRTRGEKKRIFSPQDQEQIEEYFKNNPLSKTYQYEK